MSALSIQPTFPIFTDIDGQPLENGYIWIGTENLDPQTNPINVYWDAALTIAATQPIRTLGGYPSRSGTPARMYVNSDYSIRVQNRNGSTVYSAPAATEQLGQISGTQVDFVQAGTGAVTRTMQNKVREYAVSVKDFGAVGDGVTDDRNAINAAFTEVISRGAGTVFFPDGTYYVSDFVGNTNYGGVTQNISIAVDADVGAILNCNPSVYANTALFLRFQNLDVCTVRNLKVQCNDKTSTAIFISGTNQVRSVIVDNCQTLDCFGVNNAGATTSVYGIVVSSAVGYACSITNCQVINVRRAKTTLSCQAIAVTGFINTWVENNSVFNVRHDGTALQDADGIVVFSYNDGTGRYYRLSTATIINNRIVDCEGRFIKLQTHGSALVEGNTMTILNAITLIANFQFVDSQVAQATIINNKIEAGSTWTGGSSSTICSLQLPLTANVANSYELFTQKFSNNEVYLRKIFTYGFTCTPFESGAQLTSNLEISNNTILRDVDLISTSGAVSRFLYFSSIVAVGSVTGRAIWKIFGNQVAAEEFISVGPTRADYTDKWWLYVYNNIKYGSFNFLIRNAGASPYDFPYTSNSMIRDNQMGTTASQVSDLFGAPINSSKLINGSDFSTGDGSAGTISPAPANWNNGHFGRNGGVLFAETVSGATAYRYISRDDGTNWYQV